MGGSEGIVESVQIGKEGKASDTEAVDCKWFIRAPPRSKVSPVLFSDSGLRKVTLPVQKSLLCAEMLCLGRSAVLNLLIIIFISMGGGNNLSVHKIINK